VSSALIDRAMDPASSYRPSGTRIPDGLSAEQLRKSLDGIPSTLQGMRSPMGEPSRSECVAGMDMLNDLFQRQARRLESQLYQRAQDQHTIEVAQRQAQLAMAKLRQLEQHHVEQIAKMQHGTKSLHSLQHQMREARKDHEVALNTCEALQRDVSQLRDVLQSESPRAAERIRLHCSDCPPVEALRRKAEALEAALNETERSAMEHIGATPSTYVAMSSGAGGTSATEGVGATPAMSMVLSNSGAASAMGPHPTEADSNPLHELSVIADYASKARVSQAIMGSPLSSATRSLSCEAMMDGDDLPSLPRPAATSARRGTPGL